MYLKGKQALIIDDMPEVRSSMRSMLTSLGVESSDQTGTARDAVERMQSKFYDIIICDYYLGDGTDGQQILELVRRNQIISRKTLFIIVTAERSQDRVVSAADFFPDDYLVKPFTADTLGKRTFSLLGRKEYFREVYDAFDAKDTELAIKNLEPLCEVKNRYWIDAMRQKGDYLLQTERYEDAIALYEDILAMKQIPWAVMGKVKGMKGLGKIAEGQQLLAELLEHHTEYLAGYDMSATLYMDAGDSAGAQQMLERALEITPATHRLKRAGKLALESGDADTALKYLTSVVDRGKYSFFKEPEDYTMLANAHMDKGYTQQARETLDMVKKRFPDTPDIQAKVQAFKAMTWQKEGKDDKAKALLAPLLANADSLPEAVRMDIAKACFLVGDDGIAGNLLGDIMKSNHDNEALKKEAVKMLESVGRGGKSKELVADAIQEVISLNNVGAKLLRDGKLEEASQLLAEAAEKLPRNVVIVMNAAYALLLHLQQNGANADDLAKVDRYIASVAHSLKTSKGLPRVIALRKQLRGK